jgi:hypothetical protein
MPPSLEPAGPHGVMEGKGAYNRHAIVPAGGGVLGMPFLERAVLNVSLGPQDQPITIADYGSSQGKNSLAPMQLAIRCIRSRLHPNHPVFVYHIDQPSNDFNSLFEVLDSDPLGYSAPNVYPCAIGRSFYEQVLPPASVHIGWCSYAAVWLSRIPGPIPGHFIAVGDRSTASGPFAQQAAQDWKLFLSLRARELRAGGCLVVVLPAVNEDGASGFEKLMDYANAVLVDMVTDGAIRQDERERMVLGSYPRRKSELLAPFKNGGEFEGLVVKECEVLDLPDAAWMDYQRDGDRQVLASRYAMFFRSVFAPSLASAITRVRNGDEQALRAFADRLSDGLTQKLVNNPSPLDSLVQVMVVEKREGQR